MYGSALYSFILSQIFGIYFIITAVIMLSRVVYYRQLIADLTTESSLIVLGGWLGLLLGLCLVGVHNIWVLKPRVALTLVCWLILIKSLLWLSAPEKMLSITKRVYAGIGYYIVVLVLMLSGIILMSRGYYLYVIKSITTTIQ